MLMPFEQILMKYRQCCGSVNLSPGEIIRNRRLVRSLAKGNFDGADNATEALIEVINCVIKNHLA